MRKYRQTHVRLLQWRLYPPNNYVLTFSTLTKNYVNLNSKGKSVNMCLIFRGSSNRQSEEETDNSSKLRFFDSDLTKTQESQDEGLINGLTLYSESTSSCRLLPPLFLRRRFIGDEAWFHLHQTQRTMHASVNQLWICFPFLKYH